MASLHVQHGRRYQRPAHAFRSVPCVCEKPHRQKASNASATAANSCRRRRRSWAFQASATTKRPRVDPSSVDSALKSPDLRLRSKPTYGVHYCGASVCLLYFFFAVICPP
ncbi:hypothetical protein MRX96_006580 [Rhipicephalus microplus]